MADEFEKATPRPWKVVEEAAIDYRPDCIFSADGNSRIAVMYGGGPVQAIDKPTERANARLIVAAVNERGALREALRQAMIALRVGAGMNERADAYERIRKLLEGR